MNLSNPYNKRLAIIVFLGLVVRLVFLLFFAESFFNRPNIYIDGDTQAWALSFQNLIETGTYTINPGNEYGFFARMPGYSFFIGIIWLFFRDWDLVYPVVAYSQIFLDVVAIWIIYKIAFRVFNKENTAIIASLLYAVYPFIIVWNPVVYSESVSVFLMLLSLWFFLGNKNRDFFYSGVFLGIGIMFRPQLLFLVPIMFGMIIYYKRGIINKAVLYFVLALIVTYGIWPARNMLLHNKFIITQDLRGIDNWNEDVISFMQYTYSVKAEWEPQFSSILKNQQVHWPKEAYISDEDSLKLEYAVNLAKNCGSGFSYWQGYWKEIVLEDGSCTKEIARIFKELREGQIKHNPYNFWIKVPINNLSKALFKMSLNENNSNSSLLLSLVFIYRIVLIFIGLAGIIQMIIKRNRSFFLILSFFLLLYIVLCFGTSPQMRNIEMRYFLHADILLLLPTANFIYCTVQLFILGLKKQK